MAKIKNELQCSIDCLLCKGCRSPFIPLDGDIDAEILIIGEGPGKDEDLIGKPFVGDAGKLLREALQMAKVTNFAVTNSVRCRPPENRNPTAKEIKTCFPFLVEDIKSMPNLELIVLLGNIALQSFCGIKGGILKLSGKLMQHGGYNVLPILHPAYILRNQDELKTFYEHIARIPNALSGSLVDLNDLGDYEVINTLERWKYHLRELRLAGEFAFDLETSGLKPYYPDSIIKCCSFSYKKRHATCLPFITSKMSKWNLEDWNIILKDLKIIFESTHIRKIGQNVKYDALWLRKICNIIVKNIYWDTMIGQHLLNENESNGLKDLVWKHTKLGNYAEALSGKVQDIDDESLQTYCMVDTDCTFRIYKDQEPLLRAEPKLLFLLTNLLAPVSSVLLQMELNGVGIDTNIVDECEIEADKIIDKLIIEMGKEKSVIDWEDENDIVFNPNSHTQLREILFKYEGLPILKETAKAKKPSTDRDVLEQLSDRSNLCKLLVDYSVYSTFRSKSIKEIKDNLMPDGKVHTTYWLTNTVTGRSASKEPPLQTIVKGDKDVLGIRRAFTAESDCLLVEFDYNQVQLRIMAELANDDVLKEALKGDVHTATAALILGKKLEEVTVEERRLIGKTFNFGLIFGMTEYGIMQRLGCDKSTALRYLAGFFSSYNKTYDFMRETERLVRRDGYIISLTGRYRRLPHWKELNDEAIREAINMPMQDIEAYIMFCALIGIDKYLKENNLKSYLIMETHDSCTLNMCPDEIKIIPDIKLIMITYFKNYMEFKTPLKVDVKVGTNLANLEEIE